MNVNETSPKVTKNEIKEIITCTIALFIICLVATAALSFTNSVTKDKIAQVEKAQADSARSNVCPEAASFEMGEVDGETSIYVALDDDGNQIGYAVSTTDTSYGGDIVVMTGLDNEGNITGVAILSINDTPGLGMNAKNESFTDQYNGKVVGGLLVSKDATGDEIQAITGATKTSEAVTRCINKTAELIFGKEAE